MKLSNDPFAPLKSQRRSELYFLQLLMGIVKLPLFILIFSLSFIQYTLISLIPSSSIHRTLTRIYSFCLFKVMLILLGESNIMLTPTALIQNYFEGEENIRPDSGDIIISNCVSYISLFWYQFVLSPLFVIPSGKDFVVCKSFFPLLGDIFAGRKINHGKRIQLSTAIKIAKKNQQPIVIFPEETFTNGKFIIKFTNFAKKLTFDGKIFIYGISHNIGVMSPCCFESNLCLHFIMMLGRFGTSMHVFSALPQDIPKLDDQFIENTRNIMATILRIPKSSFSAADRLEFYKTDAD